MLTITVGATENYDDESETFGKQGGFELQLEHSLVSLSKWESEFEKPFMGTEARTPEENLAYIRCMVVSKDPPGDFLRKLSKENFEEISAYIERRMTATTFFEFTSPQAKRKTETITAELVYYWMTVFHIPFECETWHLNRLFTLIRIADLKQEKPKKLSRAEAAARNAQMRDLNRQRREQLKSTG